MKRVLLLVTLLALPACMLDWTAPTASTDGGPQDGGQATFDSGSARDVSAVHADSGDGRTATLFDGAPEVSPGDAASDGPSQFFDAAPDPLTLATTSLPGATAGAAYSCALAATGGREPYAWTIDSGQLPAGITLDKATGMLSGTSAASGSASFSVKVTDASTPSQSQVRAFTLVVASAIATLTITTSSLPSGVTGEAYSQPAAASGGVLPYRWQVISGALPAGLSIHNVTGSISGRPSSAGTATFVVQVKDSSLPAQSSTRSLSIQVVDPLAVSTTSLPSAVVGRAYSSVLGASGGSKPYQWRVSNGTLPSGLTLDSASGTIAGTPSKAGDVTFGVTVKDASSTFQTVGASLTITVADPLVMGPTQLPDGTEGEAYSAILSASGGRSPRAWRVASGTLPPGISLDSVSGALRGTPASGSSGLHSFAVSVSDASNPAQGVTADLTLRVVAALSISTASLPNATVGSSYQATVLASGGQTPYRWSVTAGKLPTGLSMNLAGAIQGTPSTAGAFTFTVSVSDASSPQQAAQRQLSVTVTAAPLTIVTTTLPGATRGLNYSATLQAAGGTTPYTWSMPSGTLPRNLTLQSGSGVISGAVGQRIQTGTYRFTVQVTDSSVPPQQQTAQLGVTVQ